MRRIGFLVLFFVFIIRFALTQGSPPLTSVQKTRTWIFCGHVWDGRSGSVAGPTMIRIEEDRIAEVKEMPAAGMRFREPGVKETEIDLPQETCLPGLIDTHTHVLLQGDITAADYDEQLLKQSPEYRTILATVNARRALEYWVYDDPRSRD